MTGLDVTTAQGAIETALAYPRQIHEAAAAAQGVALGPWVMAVQCNFGPSDKNVFTDQYDVDFTGLRTQLQSTLAAAEDQASQFLDDFAFVRTWMSQTLPATSAAVVSAATAVTTAVDALRSTGTLTPAQVEAVVAGLQVLLDTLRTGSDQLSSGLQGLAAFAVSQEQYGTQVQGVAANVSSVAQGALADIRNSLSSFPCGAADGERQLDAFTAQFTTASQSFATIFAGLASNTTATQQALSLLVGTVLVVDNDYRPIVAEVQQGQGSAVGSALQELHLDVAQREWASLAAYAQQQLQTERAALAAQLHASVVMTPTPRVSPAAARAGSRSAGSRATASAAAVAAATARIERVLAAVYGPA